MDDQRKTPIAAMGRRSQERQARNEQRIPGVGTMNDQERFTYEKRLQRATARRSRHRAYQP